MKSNVNSPGSEGAEIIPVILQTEIGRMDKVEAREFLQWLWKSPYQYHIDDDPADCIKIENGESTGASFTVEIAGLLRERVEECMHVLGYEGAWDWYSDAPNVKPSPTHVALNAAQITNDFNSIEGEAIGVAGNRLPFSLLDEVAEASIALAEIESAPGFTWENAKNDWESICNQIANDLHQRKSVEDWAILLRSPEYSIFEKSNKAYPMDCDDLPSVDKTGKKVK